MPFDRLKEGFTYDFFGMKINLSADELPPSKYPYAKNIRQVDNIQTRPGYSLLFGTALVITTTCPITEGEVGVAYDFFFEAVGGSGVGYVWTKASGTFPTGLTLSAAGELSGTPSNSGTFNFVIRVTDSHGTSVIKPCSMIIAPALAITTTCPLADAQIDVAYSASFAATGGVAPMVWSIIAGALPTGLSMDSSGNVTGTPTVVQVGTFTVKVQDSLGGIATLACQITVQAACFDFSDDFNRANGALGSNWTLRNVGTGVSPQIISNQYAASTGQAEVTNCPVTADTTGYAEMTWTGYTSVFWGGPMVKAAVSGINYNFYNIEAMDNGGVEPRGELRIMRARSGAQSVLATSGPIPLATGANHIFNNPLRLEWIIFSTFIRLNAYVNGVLILTVDDLTVDRLLSGRFGFGSNLSTGGTANSWDNFVGHSCP